MWILNEYKLSEWAFSICRNGNNTKEIRNLITHSYWVYTYCLYIEDIEEMWSKINDTIAAYKYCATIKDRPEVRVYVKSIYLMQKLKKNTLISGGCV